ncbi:hypothetical protein GQ53DRAFT_774410 [Thozetella sp. PMI_491]|nr:hypothetical protein GQ53DRAFT_774410 [Thozetella sp. PMI_491]
MAPAVPAILHSSRARCLLYFVCSVTTKALGRRNREARLRVEWTVWTPSPTRRLNPFSSAVLQLESLSTRASVGVAALAPATAANLQKPNGLESPMALADGTWSLGHAATALIAHRHVHAPANQLSRHHGSDYI